MTTFNNSNEALTLYYNTVNHIEKTLNERPKNMRIGQYWFIEMHNAFKDYDIDNFINHYIAGNNDLDCFYIDSNIKNFLNAIYRYFIINFDEYSRK